MKKLILVAAFGLLSTGLIYAQSGIEKTKKVKQDEVPTAVQTSLQNDFDLASTDGTWLLQYLESSAGDTKTTILRPLEYVFQQKKDGHKVEISFTPQGTFKHAKGIDKGSNSKS